MSLYVKPDPQSIKDAEDREYLEQQAGSAILSVTRTGRAQLEAEAFWHYVERKQACARRGNQ